MYPFICIFFLCLFVALQLESAEIRRQAAKKEEKEKERLLKKAAAEKLHRLEAENKKIETPQAKKQSISGTTLPLATGEVPARSTTSRTTVDSKLTVLSTGGSLDGSAPIRSDTAQSFQPPLSDTPEMHVSESVALGQEVTASRRSNDRDKLVDRAGVGSSTVRARYASDRRRQKLEF